MQIKNLEYLLELKQEGSINKAAAASFISQQGLSKVLASMEAELDIKLVERSRAGVRFTEAGERLLAHAKPIIEEYGSALHEIRQLKSMECRNGAAAETLDLCVSPYVVISLLDKLTEVDSHPIQEMYHELRNERIVSALRNGDTERLFLHDWVSGTDFDPQTPADPSVRTTVLLTSELGILARKTAPLNEINREEVLSLPLVGFGGEDYQRTLELALQAAKLPVMKMSLSSTDKLTHALLDEQDPTYSIVDRHSFSESTVARQALRFVPIRPVISLRIGASYCASSQHAELFEERIKAWKSLLEAPSA